MNSIASSGIRLRPQRAPRETVPDDIGWSEIKATLRFLLLPALTLVPLLVMGVEVPVAVLYLLAAVIGMAVIAKSTRSPEPLMALALLYMPLARSYPATLIPGLNGTNVMILLLVIFWALHARRRRQPFWRIFPGNGLVVSLALLSALSALTVMVKIGPMYLFKDVFIEFKAWFEQFILFFAFINLIENGRMARRVVIYMLLGATASLLLGVNEMLSKANVAGFEGRRIFGPHVQPNDFGAFLVYVGLIAISILAVRPFDWRRWALLPWLGVVAKVLIGTFSRGAWLAMAAGVSMITWLRGLRYVFLAVVTATVVLTAFPQLIPESVQQRINQTQTQSTRTEQADASTTSRLVLWKAGLEMTMESPFLGKGFKAFSHLKQDYTDQDVRESDPHNMFLYLSSQMGIPAMLVFVAWIGCLFMFGYTLWRKGGDDYLRALGLAGAAMAVAVVAINFFGSRMVGASTTLYVWVFFAVLAHLFQEQQMPRKVAGRNVQRHGSGPRKVSPVEERDDRVERQRTRRRALMEKPRPVPALGIRRRPGGESR